MERASVLNWTPGSDAWEIRKGKKKGSEESSRASPTCPPAPAGHNSA